MRLHHFVISFIVSSLLGNSFSLAMPPLRDAGKLWGTSTENVLHVSTARVLFADYKLIRKDFPEIASYSDQQIDAWIIRNAAFMSQNQVAQQDVNTKIETDGVVREAYRPNEYRRAHVLKADTGGLIDVKGTGSIDPHWGNERNGLATLADVIREYLFEKMISKIFKHIRKFDTVKSYAVIDFGFDVKMPANNTWGPGDIKYVRAGAILRQAHVRYHQGVMGVRNREDPVELPNEQQIEIELALRKFGVTSTIAIRPWEFANSKAGDQLNIQGAEDFSVIDFGSFRVQKHFDQPLFYTYDIQGNANVSDADIAMMPNDFKFVQPDPLVAVPFEIWGNTVTGGGLDNPYIWSEELAAALAAGTAKRVNAEEHLRNLLNPVEKQLLNDVNLEIKCRAVLK